MNTSNIAGRVATTLGGLLFLLTISPTGIALAQQTDEARVTVSESDRAAAAHATHLPQHALPTSFRRGEAIPGNGTSLHRPASDQSRASKPRSADDSEDGEGQIVYPADLSYHGGPVVQYVKSHAIYMLPNGVCPIAQCWGNPEGFLKSFGESGIARLLNQYVGLDGGERYTLGKGAKVSYTPPATPLTDDDVLAVVHAVASLAGEVGYGHIYHVFLPPGQDECRDATYSQCYSPDNFNTFYYCAYHNRVDFPDIGHVLYSVEPFQGVSGCLVRPGTPNGQLVDSTNNVLSHELSEAITDPDLNAWWTSTSNGIYGEEIGDECALLDANFYFDPFVYEVDDKAYATQPEYSNARHGCTVH